MAMIKSALEIAMEKTKSIKVDKEALAANEAKQEGKKIAGEYLANPSEVDFKKLFSAIPKNKQKNARIGAFEIFTSRIRLPQSANTDTEENLNPVMNGLKVLNTTPFGENKIQMLFEQLNSFLKKYIEDAKKIDEAIRQQYEPRLKMKEQEMAARLGHAVKLDAMQDPEFAKFYKQNVSQMKNHYEQALVQAKAELSSLCDIE